MARTVKVYRISDDGRRVAAGAFRVNSESDLQTKWELHLATAGSGLYGVDGLLNSNAARCMRVIVRATKCRTIVILAAAGEPHGATASLRVLD